MNESTARAERFEVQSSPSPHYVWEVAQKPVSVQIPFGLIDRLERDAVESFRSLTSRGSEIGGLLVGVVAPGNPLVVSISDYQLIECDYSRGPLYRLSDADMGRFEQAREQRLAGGAAIAGFFRSHTRKGISLDTDDLTFFQERFRDPHHIALLVRPFATKASTAGIFIWENGKVNGDSSYLEFPFRSSELGPGKVIDPLADSKKAQPPATPPKPAARAQIVPIASRREISLPPTPPVETAQAAPAVAPPPPPAPAVQPPPPPAARAEVKAPVVEDRAARTDRQTRTDRPVRSDVVRPEPAKPEQAKAETVKADPFKAETVKADPPKADPFKAEALKSDTFKPDAFKVDPLKAKADALKAEALRATKAQRVEAPAAKPETTERQEKRVETAPFTMGQAPEQSSGKGMKLALAALLLVGLFVGAFVYPGFMRRTTKEGTTSPQDASALQLRVDHTAGDLLVSWNRDAQVIRDASKATLMITEGDQHQPIEMDLAQLRNGSVVYTPTGADTSFQLEVLDKNQNKTSSQSVRVLGGGRRPSPVQDQAPAQASSAPSKPSASSNNTAVASKPAPPIGTPVASIEKETTTPEPEVKSTPAPLKQFKAEPIAQRVRTAAPTDIADAPAVTTVGPSTGALPGMNFGGAPPSAPLPLPAAPVKPAASDAGKKSVAGTPVKAGGQIQPAVLIHRQEAEYPKLAKQTGARGTVTLTALIGKDGLIKSVKVVSGHPMLTPAAVAAVKQYRYRPTMLNGQPVEAETTISLSFDFAQNR